MRKGKRVATTKKQQQRKWETHEEEQMLHERPKTSREERKETRLLVYLRQWRYRCRAPSEGIRQTIHAINIAHDMPTTTDFPDRWTLFLALVHRSREPWMEEPLGERFLQRLLSGPFNCGEAATFWKLLSFIESQGTLFFRTPLWASRGIVSA